MANIARNPDLNFREKTKNFSTNVYRIDDRNSHIFKFMHSIMEIGIGQVKGLQDIANQSQNSLAGTEGGDLDQFFQLFGIKRDPQLVYNGNIFQENSIATFEEFKTLDAKFRIAISKMLQAFQKGGTTEGLRLMTEATCSYPVQIIEPWHNVTPHARTLETNETVILIIPDISLEEDKIEAIRARVIANLELIRPVGTLLTVKIINPANSPDNEATSDYAAAGSFMFLSDGTNQYIELLSQEKEFDLNSYIVDASAFSASDQYSTVLGKLHDNGDLDSALIVEENLNPTAPTFFVLITDGINSEIVLVYNRFFYEENDSTLYFYEVTRAQFGTTQSNWNESSNVMMLTNLTQPSMAATTEEIVYTSWVPVPLADSPDNYPLGKSEGDSNKYDSNGIYLFSWSSQSEFLDWFSKQIKDAGGEVSDLGYRLPVSTSLSNTGEGLLAALGAPYQTIRPIITPKE